MPVGLGIQLVMKTHYLKETLNNQLFKSQRDESKT